MLVQTLRLKQGWSQQQLATASGLSARTIQRIEAGQPASAETLKSIAAVFNVDFSSLQPESNMTPDASSTPTSAQTPQAQPTSFATASTAPSASSMPAAANTADRQEAEAYAHVRKLKGFYRHATVYALVIPLLTAINLFTKPHHLWFIYPAMGWGIGLLAHSFGIGLWGKKRWFSPEWEKRKVEQYLGRAL